MNNKDTLQRFVFDGMPVRGELIRLNESYQTIIHQHKYPKEIAAILGDMLLVASLLMAGVKFEGRVTVQFQGKSSLKLLVAQCNHLFELRGLAQWQKEMTESELLQQLKSGVLAIIMEPQGEGSQRYQGIVAWHGDSMAESIEAYFRQSEQIPTRLWLARDKNSVAGLLLQVMPTDENDGLDAFDHLTTLSSTLTPDEMLNLDHHDILHRLYHQESVRIFDPIHLKFGCQCSTKRSQDALLLLGKEEAIRELEEKQKIVVQCEFCSKEYIFDRADVTKLFDQGSQWLH